jgi:hypothetical protein
VLHLQRTAGNRAVRALIQRSPGDDDLDQGPSAPRSGAVTAGTFPPRPTGAVTAGTFAPRPAGEAGGGAASVLTGGPTAGPTASQVGGERREPMGGPVPAGMYGAIDTATRHVIDMAAKPAPDFAAEAAYRQDPSRVVRSLDQGWHQEMWRLRSGVGQGEKAPPVFQVGNRFAVAPGYAGPATPMKDYRGDDRTGLGIPGSATPAAPSGPSGGAPVAGPAPERPLTRAIAPADGVPGFGGTPGFVPGPQAPGRQTAQPVSTVEILAALKADPGSVYRSPNANWHAQGYQIDGGKGSTTPTAYRIEGRIFVSPDHPIKGVPTLAVPATSRGSAGSGPPGGPGTPTPGTTGPAAPAPDSSTRRVKRDLSVTKGSPGVAGELMVEDQSTTGDTTTKRARGATASIGGGKVAAIGGQSITTETKGDTSTVVKNSGNLALKPDGSLVLGGERAVDRFAGKDAEGQPIKTGSTAMSGSLGLGEKGLTGQMGAAHTNAAGTKVGATGTATIDANGNVSGQLGLQIQSKGGASLTPSVSGGISVQASDPIPAQGGGFDVTYTVTNSSGAGIAAGKQMAGGGPSASLQFGSTEASLETGSKHFDTEKQARAFRDKAASVLALERFTSKSPATVAGALEIPIGEERGSGDMSGSSIGGSVAFEGASLGYGQSESTTHKFKVRRISQSRVLVTGTVSGTKGSDVTGSGVISLARGSSNTKGFEITWEIDLGTPVGRTAFELYAKTGMPPMVGATLKSMTSSRSEEDHDNVSIPLLGTARWTGTTWEVVRTDEKGTQEQFGGAQLHDQKPSWIGRHVLGQDELHSTAGITSNLTTAKDGGSEEDYQAQIKVSGESGEYNREQLGKIFMGVPHAGTAKRSGEWTLTAQVSPDVVRELERVNRDMREARTKEDKMRVYSELVKERGAAMVGAQVGLGGNATAWNLELKGDKNFPGAAGRAALDQARDALKSRLAKDPAAAAGVVKEAQQTLDELRARRLAVADRERYTDLPDGLRDEQLKVIDGHITQFEFIRHQALRKAVKREAGSQPDPSKDGSADKGGYRNDRTAAESAEMVRLRAQIDQKETAITALDPRILRAIDAVTRASKHTVNVPNVFAGWVLSHRADYNLHWNIGITINERQSALAPKIDALRQRLIEALFAVDRKAAAEALLAQLTDRLALLEVLHAEVISAAAALKPTTTANGIKGYPKFWGSINGDQPPWGGGGDE